MLSKIMTVSLRLRNLKFSCCRIIKHHDKCSLLNLNIRQASSNHVSTRESNVILFMPVCSVAPNLNSRSLYLSARVHKGDPMNNDKVLEYISDPRRHYDYPALIQRRLEGPCLIVDVRQPEEINETGAIPDSINIPLNDVDDALEAMTPEAFRMKYGTDKPTKGTLLIFSCRSGRRSLSALAKAMNLGYLNSANYKGGWLDWEKQTKIE